MTETFFEFVGKIVLYGIGAVGIAYGLLFFSAKNGLKINLRQNLKNINQFKIKNSKILDIK